MKALFPLLVLFLILPLCVGCRSSRTGSTHIETESDRLEQSRSDSINFTEKFARYLREQESNLVIRIIKYYPSSPSDTASHGAIESVTDLNLNHKDTSDSTVNQKSLTVTSDTTSNQSKERAKELTTLTIQPVPWYGPFIPYAVFALIIAFIYYFRRNK